MTLATESHTDSIPLKGTLALTLHSPVILNEVSVVPLLPHQKRIPLFLHLPRIDDINNIVNGDGRLGNVGGNYNLSYARGRLYKHCLLFFTG